MSSNNLIGAAIAIVATIVFASSVQAVTTSLSCPASITTQQSGAAVDGWNISEAVPNQKHLLRAAGFSDGPPKDQAQLRPQVQSSKTGNKSIYGFEGVAADGYWLECSYNETRVVASKKIPAELKSCTVTYGAIARAHSEPAIKSIVCK
jgi:hypothetical protein